MHKQKHVVSSFSLPASPTSKKKNDPDWSGLQDPSAPLPKQSGLGRFDPLSDSQAVGSVGSMAGSAEKEREKTQSPQ